ncbi:MAG TPA: ABC transporter substrate binding protein, partial [Acidobacteriota bacterium]|nr:ABC transporter substrate binding protein [Acidobacteriota bacterium]
MKREVLIRFSDSPSDNLKSKIQNLKWGWGFALAVVFALCGAAADAQQPKKLARVCYLGTSASVSAIDMRPFRERLRELGYVEGQDVTIEPRDWEGKVEHLPDLVAELVRLNCDVILTSGTEAAQAAKSGTKTIPVVMGYSQDAV